MSRQAPGLVAVLVKGYPRLSETFIAQELLALERRGLRILIISLRQPTDSNVHELHRAIKAPLLYLPEYLRKELPRVAWALWRVARRGNALEAVRMWLADLRRDRTRSRVRRFGQALVLAAELPSEATWLHAHFMHTPGSVARYAAALRNLPFSLSAHAKDVWTIPDWEKREKLGSARWTVTCSRMNEAHLRGLAPLATLELVHHGLDASRFPAPTREPADRDGGTPDRRVTILCVARAVEKKGLDLLLAALARLPISCHWRLVHVGGGPLAATLERQAQELGLDDRVEWRGPQAADGVLAALRDADLFCLPSRIARDGDRDGLPNVLMEAMSQELAVVATRVAAIPELVVPGQTGLLIEPDDPQGLADALAALIAAPARRQELGREGRRRVIEDFSFTAGIDRLAERFGLRKDTRPHRSAA